MKIARVDVFQRELSYAGGTYTISGKRHYTSFDATFVRITTDCGVTGWGESTPFGSTYIAEHAGGVRAALQIVAPSLLGLDPRTPQIINVAMDQVLKGHQGAKAALDVACWDIFGQYADMPVCALLGGSTGEILPLISSIPSAEPEVMRKSVAAFREQGYRGHSIKIGHSEAEGGPLLDAECVRACLSDRLAGEFFLVDANGGLSVEHALRFLTLLGPADIVLEAPCATWAETLRLRPQCRVPILLDELIVDDADVAMLIRHDAADGVGLKITKAGGLTAARRQVDLCRAAGLTLSVQDTVGSDIAFAAIVHCGQTVPNRLLRCILDTRDMVSITTASVDVERFDDGVRTGTAPGLGLTVDEAAMGEPIASFV
ncbi:MAG: enolase C-terminal domain-like protein [Pseudomonadota bacterium]